MSGCCLLHKTVPNGWIVASRFQRHKTFLSMFTLIKTAVPQVHPLSHLLYALFLEEAPKQQKTVSGVTTICLMPSPSPIEMMRLLTATWRLCIIMITQQEGHQISPPLSSQRWHYSNLSTQNHSSAVWSGIHLWREHLSKVPDTIKGEYLPSQVSYSNFRWTSWGCIEEALDLLFQLMENEPKTGSLDTCCIYLCVCWLTQK